MRAVKLVLFGASGMVGQGVLRECLRADDVTEVVLVVRAPTGQTHAKLREVTPKSFTDLSPLASSFTGVDACMFCLGVSAAGMPEADYTHVTYDLALAAARAIHAANSKATFIYVSGGGTDSTEKGRTMWARVKGRTENELLRMFERAFMFRPGLIRPMHGEVSKTPVYRATYRVLGPALGVLQRLAPRYVTTTEIVGRAMLAAVRRGADRPVLENADINALASRG